MNHTVFWITFVLVSLIRVLLAAYLPLFGDEAFYWQESQRLAAGYSDLPAGMAWLLAAATSLFGHHLLALRLPSLLAGLLPVLLLRAWVRRQHDDDSANSVATLALLVPIAQAVGVLAIPDAALTFCLFGASLALLTAIEDRRWRHWLLFSLLMALAWFLHWRAAMIYFGGLMLILAPGSGRQLWREPRHWLAHVLAFIGLLPTVLFNAAQGWPSLRFQAVDRHDWGFHAGGLQMPLEQALVMSPILFLALLLGCARQIRVANQADEPARTGVVWIGLGVALAYFLIGCFADQERTRVHWPWPAFLLLLPVLAGWVQQVRWRWLLLVSTGLAAVPIWLGLAALHWQPQHTQQFGKRFGANFLGYAELAERLRPLLKGQPVPVLVADNFLLGAQLDWQLQQSPFVLDAARNQEHGRQVQLSIWGLDEASLQRAAWQEAILVVDDSALFASDRFGFYRSLCQRLGRLRWLGEYVQTDTHRQFTIWSVQRAGPLADADCAQPILGQVFPVEHQPGLIVVGGYAVQHFGRVARVELRDGSKVLASDVLDAKGPVIKAPWSALRDGNGDHIGFRFELPVLSSADIKRRHRYQLFAVADDGQERWLGSVHLPAPQALAWPP